MSSGGDQGRHVRIETDWQDTLGQSVFRAVWAVLDDFGCCDRVGGQELRRLRAEWQQEGRPRDVYQFIRDRANIGPAGDNQEGESHD